MILHRLDGRSEKGYTTFGCMWERGTVSADSGFELKNDEGVPVEIQSETAAWWPDHSVKWTRHSVKAELAGKHPVLTSVENAQKQDKLPVAEDDEQFTIYAGTTTAVIAKTGTVPVKVFMPAKGKTLRDGRLIMLLEEPVMQEYAAMRKQTQFTGEVLEAKIEELGPLKCVIRQSGVHTSLSGDRKCCPFILRVTVWKDSERLDIQHTYIYDGDVNKDYLKGLGMSFSMDLEGAVYNRHVQFLNEYDCFSEPAVLLTSWRPRLPLDRYRAQVKGKLLPETGEEARPFRDGAANMPAWSDYRLVQDSAQHFVIEKKTCHPQCCYIEAVHGRRAPGAMVAGDRMGGVMAAGKDFWQKYPSGLEVKGMTEDKASVYIWFRTPRAEAYDYRHYDIKGYSQTYYEGFDVCGADPVGIANTGEFSVMSYAGTVPGAEKLRQLHSQVQKPAVYMADIEYYHKLRAFGYWSLKKTDTPMETWLEEQLEKAVDFYKNEVEQRSWYGFYNYGDFMHTYDAVRHCWKYDMGGYAWQNTELVPTLWLWLYFMRTQREDVFELAEAMSRHCSDVDVYHLGPYKGIGSRHNVRHWGCSCKEARIGMAGHHRFYYYITGDGRMKDIFDDAADADMALLNVDPLRFFYDKSKMVEPTHARSGPDWSTFCSNWMTRWERFDDESYRNKLCTGIEDIKKAPLKLVSGSDFEYDPESGHLRYIGEKAAGGTHLQICMGAAEVWMELTLLLDDPEWTRMLAAYGRFYYLSREEQVKESNGLINQREFTLPFMAAAVGAFAADYYKDRNQAEKTWRILMRALISDCNNDGFLSEKLPDTAGCAELREISWITTNFVSQWCLNLIVALDLIREELPHNWEEMKELMKDMPEDGFHKA